MATTRVQSHFRFRNDDGSESAATWKAATDTNINSADLNGGDFNFRLRINVRQTGTTAATFTGRLRYSLNGSAYAQINATGVAPVIAIGSANLTDDAATTQQISAGTFVAGKVDDVSAQCGATASMGQNVDTEHEFNLRIRAGYVKNGDVLTFRVYQTTSALNTYSVTAQVTIVDTMTRVLLGANATAPVENTGAGTTLDLTTLTVGSENNRVLVVQITWGDANPPSTPTVVWDNGASNQSCTLIKHQANGSGRSASLYGLVNPIAGNKTLRVACGGNAFGAIVSASYYYNADQTGGTTTFPNSNSATGSSGTASVAITSAVGRRTVSCYGAPSTTATPTQILLFFLSGAGASDGGASDGVGASSVTHSWTITSGAWAIVGTDIATVSTTINADVTEAASAAESSSNTLNTSGSETEAATATETNSARLVTQAGVTEAATATETCDATLPIVADLTESAIATDDASARLEAAAGITEQATADDQISNTAVMNSTLTESCNATESSDAHLDTNAEIVEATPATSSESARSVVVASVIESSLSGDLSSATAILNDMVEESATASESSTGTTISQYADGVTEQANATESSSATVITSAQVIEQASAQDLCSSLWVTEAGVLESASADDVLSAGAIFESSIIEACNAGDFYGTGNVIDVDIHETCNARTKQWIPRYFPSQGSVAASIDAVKAEDVNAVRAAMIIPIKSRKVEGIS